MKLLAIDGNSILNRAFYGIRLLSNKDGVYTNAIFGFLNIFLKFIQEQQPDATAIAFDVSRMTFRNEQYDQYKANRKGMPEELAVQLPLIKEILTDMGYRIVACEGYEGDDILGTLAARCGKDGNQCVVATGDRDCLQLVSDCVTVCLVKTKENICYTPDDVRKEFGFDPAQVIDVKALMGDSSDNIPGVKGIGKKTASSLIQKNGSLENIYANLDTLDTTERVKKLLQEGKEIAFLSKKLATICVNTPIDSEFTSYIKNPADEAALSEILTRLELFSFFDKLNVSSSVSIDGCSSQQKKTACPFLENAVSELESALTSEKNAAVLLAEKGLYLNVNGTIYFISSEYSEQILKTIASHQLPIWTFMAKPLYKLAHSLSIRLNITFDAELAAYLLSSTSKSYDIQSLKKRYLPLMEFDCDEKLQDIAVLPYLCEELDAQLNSSGMKKLYEDIELPLCAVLADMETKGFAIDKAGVEQFGKQLDHNIKLTSEQIIRLAGEDFNINSTRELGHILFEKLGLPAKKKTKTGYSTNIAVLEELADQHEIIPQIIEYRKLTKLNSTYVVGLLKVLAEDGRVHSTFNQTETRTGRISSTEPNVQNIPVRTKLGSEMRRFFVAAPGYVLVDADYSQIELRILAHIADDKNMIEAFLNKADIHAITASQVFGYPLENLPNELRNRAKAINFGIVYGIGAYSLSRNINVSIYEAKQYIEAYLKVYSGVARYQKQIVEQAKKDGYVTTIYGRRRDLSDIHSTNKNIRAFAERVALNTPVQGTAADIIKLAMIRVHDRIRREGLDARLILQVHDELIVEAKENSAYKVKQILKEEMEGAANLRVPLIADVSSGKNWYEAKQ